MLDPVAVTCVGGPDVVWALMAKGSWARAGLQINSNVAAAASSVLGIGGLPIPRQSAR